MKYLSIGEISKLSNVSIQTLRYYDQIGLFIPAFTDEMTNYRYYEPDQLFYLDIIKYLRHLDLPLKKIKQIIDLPADELAVILKEQRHVIDQKIARLTEAKEALNYQQEQLLANQLTQQRPLGKVYENAEKLTFLLCLPNTTKLTPLDKPDQVISVLSDTIEKNNMPAPLQYGFNFPLLEYFDLSEIIYTDVVAPVYRKLSSDLKLVKIPAQKSLCITFEWSTSTYLKHYQKLLDTYRLMYPTKKDIPLVYEISTPMTYTVKGKSRFITTLKLML